MKLSEISKYLGGNLQGADVEFEFVNTDSRTINPGELFVALNGDHFDGHRFIEQAHKKGAIAAIVDQSVSPMVTLPFVKVPDTRKALGEMAALHRRQFQIPVIALTGSCGKTTVKEMLRAILTECGAVLANRGTLNNDIGVPLTLLNLTHQHHFAVIEMGANHPGEIAYLTQLTRPNVAFINNIAPAHLEGFGSVEGVAQAKSEIFQGLEEDGTVIINADDNFAAWLRDRLCGRRVVSFGIKDTKADINARELKTDSEGRFSFILHTPIGEITIKLSLLGEHNVLNALAAAAAAQIVSASLPAIKVGLENMEPVTGRLVTRYGFAGTRIFDDTYNANPFSVKAALQVLARYPSERVFVLGDMGELGLNAEDLHSQIGQFAKELGIQRLYAVGKLSRFAVKAFGTEGYHFNTQADLCCAVRAILQPEMTVLVKGSRSAKMENVVAALIDK